MLKTACQKSLDGLILRILNDLYCQKPTVLQFRTTNMNKLNYKHGRCNKSHFYDVLVFPKAIVFSSTHSKVSTSLHKEFTLLGHRELGCSTNLGSEFGWTSEPLLVDAVTTTSWLFSSPFPELWLSQRQVWLSRLFQRHLSGSMGILCMIFHTKYHLQHL